MLVKDHKSFRGMDEMRTMNEGGFSTVTVYSSQRRGKAGSRKSIWLRRYVVILALFGGFFLLGHDSLRAQDAARTAPRDSGEGTDRSSLPAIDEESLRVMRERNAFANRPFEPIDQRFEEASPFPPVSGRGLPFRYERQLQRVFFSEQVHGQWIPGEVSYHVHALDLLHVFRLKPRPSYSSEKISPRLPAEACARSQR